ncbi:MAG: RNA 3'-phosphate cyclase [Chloroflexi bacterium]|nr:RNA 3'-phosphate cyclase [Chloroflexota bacterium]
MITIDGGAKSGSGTIVRYSVALASLLGEDLHMVNIRAKRDKPGLRPQHLASVKACAQLCAAYVEGAAVDSRELVYKPGKRIGGGHYRWDIGTAGSTTLLVMTLLPIALFADGEISLRASGGIFQDFAPSAHHMQNVLFPVLSKMGIEAKLEIIRPGYVPTGGGIIEVRITPMRDAIKPLTLLKQGKIVNIRGLALSSHLKEARVSQRLSEECHKMLAGNGYEAKIELIWDETAPQAGASLAIWAETDSGCLLGADQAGARGRRSEEIGGNVARNLLADLKTGATVDRYLADQLIIYAALAKGKSSYIAPRLTEHVETNLWLVEKFGARTGVEGNAIHIDGLGYSGRP